MWNTAIGAQTADGTVASAWICVGPSQLEVEVTPGLAIDRVGRMIEVPRTVCIRIGPWLANQTVSDLTSALAAGSGNILVDVFATFIPCTRGVTPCFATQDDYDATDAFSANRLLDSFAMQLVLRTDSSPQLPKDPWLSTGLAPGAAMTTDIMKGLKQIFSRQFGPRVHASVFGKRRRAGRISARAGPQRGVSGPHLDSRHRRRRRAAAEYQPNEYNHR